MDKCPVCACLMKRDLEEAADPYEFLDENFSISGILDNLDKLSPKELKCACCLFGTALQQARKKKKRKWYRRWISPGLIAYLAENHYLYVSNPNENYTTGDSVWESPMKIL